MSNTRARVHCRGSDVCTFSMRAPEKHSGKRGIGRVPESVSSFRSEPPAYRSDERAAAAAGPERAEKPSGPSQRLASPSAAAPVRAPLSHLPARRRRAQYRVIYVTCGFRDGEKTRNPHGTLCTRRSVLISPRASEKSAVDTAAVPAAPLVYIYTARIQQAHARPPPPMAARLLRV